MGDAIGSVEDLDCAGEGGEVVDCCFGESPTIVQLAEFPSSETD